MKTTVIALFTFLILFTSCSNDDDDTTNTIILTDEQIPTEIKTYIQTHFAANSIVKAEKETELGIITYDIYLNDNLNLEFNETLAIISIESLTQLPNSVIPQPILNYVASNYPTNFITDWELELNHQQVELNNNIELEFQLNGDFIRIDND